MHWEKVEAISLNGQKEIKNSDSYSASGHHNSLLNMCNIMRAKVVGGWLVKAYKGHGGITFVPDPNYDWEDIEEFYKTL
ncbi:hypothetical protein J7384_08700 [Endozoicomonas sp. G2_1]|uniref:hypothetical protein n=1 Tax=Endozoicomonas sp. G2_1 TaxID=2821091 RepID=UPI001ADA678F|nr:hypothetical protein [Endozoicomonas sp. G2_1]MBO9490439.1 hypothetical protein [Endozoicomonas sp. G2_1]